MKKGFFNSASGGIAIIFAILLPVLVGVIMLVVDGGRMVGSSNRLQNTADSIALGSAKWIVRIRQDPQGSDIELPSNFASETWLPTETELRNYAESNLLENFETDQSYTKLAENEFRILSRNIPNTPNSEVKVKLCADSKTDFTVFAGNEKSKRLCSEATALIEPGGLRDAEIAVSFEANYGMSGNSTRQRFSWAFVGTEGFYTPAHGAHYAKGIWPKYFGSSEQMQQNNVYVALIPFTEKMNIFPYASSFIDNYSRIDADSKPEYEPAVLMSNYPMLTSEGFDKLISSSPDAVTYPSFYDMFRKEKDSTGKRGEIYENNPQLAVLNEYITTDLSDVNKPEAQEAPKKVLPTDSKTHIYHPEDFPGNNGNLTNVTKVIQQCEYRTMRSAYGQMIKNRYIQPLTNSYEAIDFYFQKFYQADNNLGSICDHNEISKPKVQALINGLPTDWRAPNDLEEDVPSDIKDMYKNKYLNCHLNINGYGEDTSAANWIGFWWAWQVLDPRNRGKWNAPSWNEQEMQKVSSVDIPDRSNMPSTEEESKRKKVLIHVMTEKADYTVTGKNLGYCDAYTNVHNVTRNPAETLMDDTFQKNSDFTDSPKYGSLQPTSSNTTSYKKLCDAIKQSGVEIYIVKYVTGAENRTTSFNEITSCASKPENVVSADSFTIAGTMDKLFSGLGNNYKIRLVE